MNPLGNLINSYPLLSEILSDSFELTMNKEKSRSRDQEENEVSKYRLYTCYVSIERLIFNYVNQSVRNYQEETYDSDDLCNVSEVGPASYLKNEETNRAKPLMNFMHFYDFMKCSSQLSL